MANVTNKMQLANHPLESMRTMVIRKGRAQPLSEDDTQLMYRTKAQINFLADLFKMPVWKMSCIVLELGYNHFWKEYKAEVQTALRKQANETSMKVEDEISLANKLNNPDIEFASRLLRENVK